MNKKKQKNPYLQIGMTAFFVLAASMLFYFLLFRTSTIRLGLKKFFEVVNPILYGFVIAYLLDPQMTFLENIIYRIMKKLKIKPGKRARKVVRIICAFAAILIAILIIYALLAMVVPELITSIRNIIINIPVYQRNINSFIRENFHNPEADTRTASAINDALNYLSNWANHNLLPVLNDMADTLPKRIVNFITFLKNIFLGTIVSVYVLVAKEVLLARFKRILYAFLPTQSANRALLNLRFVDEKFGGFLIGKVIDSAIIGVICYVVLKIMNMPFTMLISVIVGVTNIIPFFGPFIGAVPSAVLIFVVNPIQTLYFIIFIIILQQFDGNLLGPRILGSSVGVSSFMVIVAILLGGGFFGVGGMVLGVPICAILGAVIQEQILRRMKTKDLPGDLESYNHVERINPRTHEIVPKQEERSAHSLYDAIKYRKSDIREFDLPIENHPWDLTMEEVLARDAKINGEEMEEAEEGKKEDKETEERKKDESGSQCRHQP